MLNTADIWRLYANVLHNDLVLNHVSERDVRVGIQQMGKAYSTECANFNATCREFPNFNQPAFRCAYLHKYAPLHTYIVLDAMLHILKEKRSLFQEHVRPNLKICCLGGGPGNDIVGVLAALYGTFNLFPSSATVIDCMRDWESTFKSLLDELKYGEYGKKWTNLDQYLEWDYVGADLLKSMSNEVKTSIASSNFVTMVKFVSAASCTTAEWMLEEIFSVVQPGTIVLFIDNAAGGFTQAVERSSKKNFFESVLPPRRHVNYENEHFKSERFGYTSCFKTKVTILLLKKPLTQLNRRFLPQSNFSNLYVPAIKDDNLNRKLIKVDPYANKHNNDNLNLNSKKTDSYKSPIKEGNLNLVNQQKIIVPRSNSLQPHSSRANTSAIKENNLNLLKQQKLSASQSKKKIAPKPPQSLRAQGNLNYYERRTDFRSINVPSSSYVVTFPDDFPIPPPRRVRYPSQQSNDGVDDDDDTSCTCCVIS